MKNQDKAIQKPVNKNKIKNIFVFKKDETKNSLEYFNLNYSTNYLKQIKTRPMTILAILISSLIFNIAFVFFLSRAKTIPSGLASIPSLLSYVFLSLKPYFAIFYFLINLPLFLFFYKKIKKTFLYSTFFWMICQIGWEQLWHIEPLYDFIYSNTSVKENWSVSDGTDLWLIFFYTIIGAILVGISSSLIWKFGGSTGGTDIIAYYFSTTRKKSVGSMMMVLSSSISATALITLYIISTQGLVKDESSKVLQIFGINTFATILYIFIVSFVVNKIYPKYKKVLITIYTTKSEEITNHLNKIKYWHSFNIWEGTSGYTSKKTQKIESIALVLEVKSIVKEIKNIDPDSFISLRNINIALGKFDSVRVD